KVFDDAPAQGILQENDVILSIDEYDIAEDGSIQLSEDILTDYKHAIDLHHPDETVAITFSRNGIVSTTNLPSQRALDSYSLVKSEQFDKTPEYYIYGGILFVPLNMNLIKRWGNDWSRTAPVSLLQARNEWSSPDRRELVVALQVLASDVNLGYHDWRNWIVQYVNDEPVRDFAHFAEMVKNNPAENLVMENKNGYQLVLNHEDAVASEEEILSRYRIPAAHSAGLFRE
ncbi:MAG: protease, partial [Gammaproteobacteria bacterium]|nr:protease [Gammaproteobacteria bacterium]